MHPTTTNVDTSRCSISELESVHLGYEEEGCPNVSSGSRHHSKRSSSIRVSALPEAIRETAMKLDVNQIGELGTMEVATALGDLDRKKHTNKNLRKTVAAFVVVTLLLIASVFGASLTAARLSQEIFVDSVTGFAHVKGSPNSVVKTSEAIHSRQINIGELSNEQLGNLKEIILANGDLRFVVKGHARDPLNDLVLLLIEGGTLAFDQGGITAATGDAKYLLMATFGQDAFAAGSEGNRRLSSQCNGNVGIFTSEDLAALVS